MANELHLDPEEQAILDAFEQGEIEPLQNSDAEVQRLTALFKASGNKNNRISLRLNDWDFRKAKEVALQEGIPYQTLLSSILHKYFTGRFTEAR